MNWILITLLPFAVVAGHWYRHSRKGTRAFTQPAWSHALLMLMTTASTVIFLEAGRVALATPEPNLIWTMIGSAAVTFVSSNLLLIRELNAGPDRGSANTEA